jgi:hypothetical protein
LSKEEVALLVSQMRAAPNVSDMVSRLTMLQAQVQVHNVALSPMQMEFQRKQHAIAVAARILYCPRARDYFQHCRFSLMSAHFAAAAISSGDVALDTCFKVQAGQCMADNFSEIVSALPRKLAGAGAALVEGIPFLGAGIGALSAALTANEDRNVMMRCQSVARLARSGAELDMLIDALARKLTLLQWNLLTSDRALQEEVLKPGFRAWAKAKLGELAARAVIFAQVNVKGFRALNEAETKAFADVEYVLDLVAKGKLDPKCEPHIEADPLWRGQEIALRMAKEILPGRASYEDVLPSPTEEERIATEKLMAAQTATTTTPNQGGGMDWPVSPLVLPRPGLSESDLSKLTLMRNNGSSNNSSTNGLGGPALPSPTSSISSGDATPNSLWQRSPSVVDPAAAAAAAAELAAVKAEASRAKELADRLALDNERKAEEVRAAAERLAKAEAQLKFVQAEQEAARQAESAKAEQDAKHRAEVKRQFAEQAKILKGLKDKADGVVDGGDQAMMSAAVNPQNHRRGSVGKGSLPDVVLFRVESRVDDQSVRLERMARFLEELGYREKQEQQEEKQREHDKRELFRRKKRAADDGDDDEDGSEMGGGGGVVGV